MKRPLIIASLLVFPLHAGPRTSTDYTLSPETTDSGGGRVSSINYTIDNAIGSPGGVSSSANLLGKSGYAGQLYDVTGLALSAATATVNEGGTRQLAAQALLDDTTLLALDPSAVAWNVLTGPLTSISAGGLVTAGLVYQDTAATARGACGGGIGTLGLSVLNTQPDNFGSYAGDGLDDGWQHQYFGADNPDAAPAMDPDGDGQNNEFEFIADLIPTDPASRFLTWVATVIGQPDQRHIVLQPLAVGRTYVVLTSPDLTGSSWSPLSASPPTIDNGNQRTVTDTQATAAKKFYRIEITKPH